MHNNHNKRENTKRNLVWHAIHRNEWRSREKIHNFARFEVAHIQFDLHERIMLQVPHAKTRALIYTYPAVLYGMEQDSNGQHIPTTARSWRSYGNLFEQVGAFDPSLPYLRNAAKQPIYDYPSTGMRYWLDLTQLELEPYVAYILDQMRQRYQVRPCDDADLQSVLSNFGQSSTTTDTNRDGITDDTDLLEILMQYGNTVSHYPVFGYLEKYMEGFMIDNYPEYIRYTNQAQLNTDAQIEGYARYCRALRLILPNGLLFANVYEGGDFTKVSGTDDAPVFSEPCESMLQMLDGIFFENWRWHWAARTGMLPQSKIEAIERRIDWIVARDKIALLAVNLAYDDEGYQQRLDAIEYALRRWGNRVRFSEFRQLYANGRSVVEANRTMNP
ncbi:MAG: hypothetical protein KatS3mg087_1530 [Patescibacteria group bacterium]|nr:MAG: hypothetical protein KatS3mg087_1530 [Patescibacteria group bacterium]